MVATAAVYLAAVAVGLVAGLRFNQRRFLTERTKRRDLDARMDAYRVADTRTDLDEVGGVGPERKAALYDQDAESYDRRLG